MQPWKEHLIVFLVFAKKPQNTSELQNSSEMIDLNGFFWDDMQDTPSTYLMEYHTTPLNHTKIIKLIEESKNRQEVH